MWGTQQGETEWEWSWIDDLWWLLKANFLMLYQYYWGKTPKSLPQNHSHQTVQELKNLSFVFRKMLTGESSSAYFVQVRRDLRPRPKLISEGKRAGGERLCSRPWWGMRSWPGNGLDYTAMLCTHATIDICLCFRVNSWSDLLDCMTWNIVLNKPFMS